MNRHSANEAGMLVRSARPVFTASRQSAYVGSHTTSAPSCPSGAARPWSWAITGPPEDCAENLLRNTTSPSVAYPLVKASP